MRHIVAGVAILAVWIVFLLLIAPALLVPIILGYEWAFRFAFGWLDLCDDLARWRAQA